MSYPAPPNPPCACRTAPNREAAMVVLRRDENDKPTVWCDPCLAPLVDALNVEGLATVASCCGHGERDGSIVLADGRELLVTRFVPLGESQGTTPDPAYKSDGETTGADR